MNLHFTPELMYVGCTLFGLATGSFLNVWIYRGARRAEDPVAQKLSLNVPPRSFCPHCNRQLLWWHNIPVLSWFLLMGRCWFCKVAIPVRYPLVELAAGMAGGFSFLAWGPTLSAVGSFLMACALILLLGRRWLALLPTVLILSCRSIPAGPAHIPVPTPILESYSDPYAWMNDPADPAAQDALGAEERYTHRLLNSIQHLFPPLPHSAPTSPPTMTDTLQRGAFDFALESPADRSGPRLIRYSRLHPGEAPKLMFDLGDLLPFGSRLVLDRLRLHPDLQHVAVVLRDPTSGNGYVVIYRDGTLLPQSFSATDVFDVQWSSSSQGIVVLRAPDGRPSLVEWQPLKDLPPQPLMRAATADTQLRLQLDPDSHQLSIFHDRPTAIAASVFSAAPTPQLRELPVTLGASCHGVARAHGLQYWIESAPSGDMSLMRQPVSGAPQAIMRPPARTVLSDLRSEGDTLLWKARTGLQETLFGLSHPGHRPRPLWQAPLGSSFQVLSTDAGRVQLVLHRWTLPPTIITGPVNALPPPAPPVDEPSRARTVEVHSRDETLVPLTVIEHRSTPPRAVMLSVYGAYGVYAEPSFSVDDEALRAQGIATALCHTRGGGFWGSAWHAAGRGARKRQALDDLIACIELLRSGATIAAPLPIILRGRSAGALLAARAMIEKPELLAGVILDAPFLDPIGTLLDPLRPLNARETAEWGDPRNPRDLAALQQLSPYASIRPGGGPPVLLFASLFDREVPIAEPLKFTARLRAARTADAPVLLSLDRNSDHTSSATPNLFTERQQLMQSFSRWAIHEASMDDHSPHS